MTRKDYEAIAKKFNEARICIVGQGADQKTMRTLCSVMEGGIADVFEADNEHFDRVRFFEACRKGTEVELTMGENEK
jgi:hypothetical protein